MQRKPILEKENGLQSNKKSVQQKVCKMKKKLVLVLDSNPCQ